MKVVGGVGGDIGGQPRNQIPVLKRIAGRGSRRAHRVAGEEATDINLGIRCQLHVVITLAGHEMPLDRKIVVDARNGEFAGSWETRLPENPRMLAPSQRLWLQAAFDCGSYLFHICETRGLSPRPCGSHEAPVQPKFAG